MNKAEIEIWEDIPNYEGYYQVSNLGRVRSLDRIVITKDKREYFYNGFIIKGTVSNGYRQTNLRKGSGSIGKTFKFSQLVAMAFLNHEPNGHALVVDHINGDRSDDKVENLRVVTHRANSTTCFRSNEESFSSGYIGVCWSKKSSKWESKIKYNDVYIYLGCHDTELEASSAYQSALSKINEGSFNPDDYKPKLTSKYKGVCFYKKTNKWKAQISINGKRKHLGYYPTELEAHKARLKAEEKQKSA